MGLTTISGSLVTNQSYQYITIGNFFSDANTQIQALGQPGSGASYYYVDDVCIASDSLVCTNFTVGKKNIQNKFEVKIFPNPSSDFLQVQLPIEPSYLASYIVVKNILGQTVKHLSCLSKQIDLAPGEWGNKGK